MRVKASEEELKKRKKVRNAEWRAKNLEYTKQWQKKNPDKVKATRDRLKVWQREYNKKYYKKNKAKKNEQSRQYYEQNKDRLKKIHSEYRLQNRDRYLQHSKNWNEKKREKELRVYFNKLKYERKNKGRQKRYYDEHRETLIKHKQEWLKIPGNRDKHNERMRQYRKRKKIEQRQHLKVA